MNINQLASQVDNKFYTEDFLRLIESHMSYLRTNGTINKITITTQQRVKYRGDLYGLLDELNIEKKYHAVISRFNGYISASDFDQDEEIIYIPDLVAISRLADLKLTTTR